MAKFAGAVFAAPMISSFALDGIARATPVSDQTRQKHHHGNMPGSPYGYYGNMPYRHMHHGYGNMTGGKGHQHGEGCDDPFWWVYGECFPFDNHRGRGGSWW